MTQRTMAVEDKGAALDAAHLFAIHILQLDHFEQGAHRLIDIGKQCEGQGELGLKVFMRLDAVARDADYFTVCILESRIQITELLRLGGAARRIVFGIK